MPAFLKFILFRVVPIALLTGLAAAGAALYWASEAVVAPGPLADKRVVVIEKGSALKAIAGQLEVEGVVEDWRLFYAYARYRRAHRNLQAGEYAFEPGVSTAGALQQLLDGKTVLRTVTIPEGLTSVQAIAQIALAEGLTGDVTVPAEGSILPETYTYTLDEERTAVIGRMQKSMRETLDELWPKRTDNLPVKTKEEAVILASIVEKETGLAEERPRVAAVFINRLRKGMALQSDPTVAYAITRGERELERPLRLKDLEIKDPYNTYHAAGLPPGPICNPGRASLEAVLNPIETKELYFVADGTGGHAFARTLEEHNRNVEKWRKIQREQRRGK